MYRLAINAATLAMAMNQLKGTPEELEFLHTALMQSNFVPQLYASTPPPDADPATVAAGAVAAQGDWSRMVHPHVLAQLVVDLAEKIGEPIPDNTFVFLDGDWKPLHMVQPSPKPAVVAPPAPPSAIPAAPQPAAAAAAVTHEQLASPVTLGGPAVLEPVIVQQAASPLEALVNAVATPLATPAPDAAPAPAVAAVAAEETGGTGELAVGDYGLPQPVMTAAKGASPFDKDPGGKVPSSAPDRMTRDIVGLTEGLFGKPASEVIGKGKGSVQRLRAYMATLQLVDQALASVPDGNCPVAYLRHQIQHLRWNASNSPAGPTMLQFENYLFKPSAAGDE